MVTKETFGKISMEIRSFDIPKRKGMGEREASEDTDLMRKSIISEFFLSERKKDKESQSVHIITERFQSSTWATQTTYFADGEALQLTPAIKFLLTIDERQLPQSCFDLDLKPILLFFVQ